jgi:hypothetical protein
MIGEAPSCMTCKHKRFGWHCDAFPEGIPGEIIDGQHDHKEPYKGDGGIQYEPGEETE